MSSADDTPEDYQFLPRLVGSYLLAFVAWFAVDRSLFIEAVTVVGWSVLTVHLVRRFGRRGFWALLGAPLAFWWAWLLWAALRNPAITPAAGAIVV